MVKTSASPCKEIGKEKQLLILPAYKMNVKCIKLYQMIPLLLEQGILSKDYDRSAFEWKKKCSASER